MHICLYIIYGCFCTKWQSWVVAAETIWPAKPKIFTVWLITEKVSIPNLNYDLRRDELESILTCGISISVTYLGKTHTPSNYVSLSLQV